MIYIPQNYWQSNYSELIKSAYEKLDNIKNEKENIEQIFDLENGQLISQ